MRCVPGMKRFSRFGDERRDMVGDGRQFARRAAAPAHLLGKDADIAARLDIVGERLQRPDDDVAMRVAGADVGIGQQHEPLRPVGRLPVLLGEERAQDAVHLGVVAHGEQELDRTLTDIARAPGGAGMCSSPCGTVRWTMASCAIQGRIRLAAPISGWPPESVMSRVAWLQKRRAGASSILRSNTPVRSSDRRSDSASSASVIEPVTAKTSLSVAWLSSVTTARTTAHAVHEDGAVVAGPAATSRRRGDDDAIRACGKARPQSQSAPGAETDPLGRAVDRDRAALLIFALAEHEMADDEEAARAALGGHLPLHCGSVAIRDCHAR